ncbi:MAG TPA: ABC transporter ATP-binding protein [bacterium]|nr:ABC transporter ATP-binding protein [bacterium]
MTDDKLIRLENVSRVYNGGFKVIAVDSIDFSVERGGFCCIAGPSGSGKTSLLNLIGGIDKPTSGDIFIENENITALSRAKLSDFRLKKLGFVFQELNLIPVLTARENIEFPLMLQGWSIEKREIAVNGIMKELGLEGLADRRPAAMSGGQQQRIAVARAVVSGPSLVLADEPTANLDSANSHNLVELMKRLNSEKNITFIFATHDESVLREARQIVYLRDGKITGKT